MSQLPPIADIETDVGAVEKGHKLKSSAVAMPWVSQPGRTSNSWSAKAMNWRTQAGQCITDARDASLSSSMDTLRRHARTGLRIGRDWRTRISPRARQPKSICQIA